MTAKCIIMGLVTTVNNQFNRLRALMLRRIAITAVLALPIVVLCDCLADAPIAPAIYSQPQSRTVKPGTVVAFKVDANGYPTLNYR